MEGIRGGGRGEEGEEAKWSFLITMATWRRESAEAASVKTFILPPSTPSAKHAPLIYPTRGITNFLLPLSKLYWRCIAENVRAKKICFILTSKIRSGTIFHRWINTVLPTFGELWEWLWFGPQRVGLKWWRGFKNI